MREKDLKIDSFVVTCMNNIYGDDAEVNNEWYLECLNKAKDTKEFEKLYLSTKDNNIICSQAYGELLKKQSLFYEGYDKYYHYVMNKAEIKKVTCSDRGGLKLGNDTFSICVSNGYGDGVFTTAMGVLRFGSNKVVTGSYCFHAGNSTNDTRNRTTERQKRAKTDRRLSRSV